MDTRREKDLPRYRHTHHRMREAHHATADASSISYALVLMLLMQWLFAERTMREVMSTTKILTARGSLHAHHELIPPRQSVFLVYGTDLNYSWKMADLMQVSG